MYIIEVTEQKAEKLKGYAEQILEAGGRMMSCLEQMCEQAQEEEEGYGERSHFMEAGSGMKMPFRKSMGERRPNAGGYQGGLGFRRGGMVRREPAGRDGYGERYQWADPYYE